ncbi:MAG: hypothetical protein GTN82_22055, partial [Candidatus Aminicenantes bacterium]|nr:hypothetical protein [Candidatus Aminicenantes bacterium]
PEPYFKLPDDFFNIHYDSAIPTKILKSCDQLTNEQQEMVKYGPYRCLHVHPVQL